jgi:AcrR family transcriptional regulator
MTAGRHRSFEKEKALEAAMLVFWRNGYSGTSLADLTEAMAINKPSLYATFGNKEELFMAALEQYMSHQSLPMFEVLFAPNKSLEERLYAHLKSIAQIYCDPNLPTGCMMVNSTSESAGDGLPQAAHKLILEINQRTKQRLIDFFTQEQAAGTLKGHSSPHGLALYLMSIVSGMSVLSRNGATQAELDEIIEHTVSTII